MSNDWSIIVEIKYLFDFKKLFEKKFADKLILQIDQNETLN